jgi:hypothetical protein
MANGPTTTQSFTQTFCKSSNLTLIKGQLSTHKPKSGRGAGTRNTAIKVQLEERYNAWLLSGKGTYLPTFIQC